MKFYIMTDKDLVIVQVIKFISFMICGITNENTMVSSRFELLGRMNHCSVTETIENSKMVKGWWMIV